MAAQEMHCIVRHSLGGVTPINPCSLGFIWCPTFKSQKQFQPKWGMHSTPRLSLADHSVPIAIPHVRVGGVSLAHGRDAAAPCFGAGDASVAVNVPLGQRFVSRSAWRRRGCCCRHRTEAHLHLRRVALGKHPFDGARFAPVNGESVLAVHFKRPRREPASRLSSGSHSAASLSDFRCWLTGGDASVRFRRSVANRRLAAAPAAHSPLSWASLVVTMCSMSVWMRLEKHRPAAPRRDHFRSVVADIVHESV